MKTVSSMSVMLLQELEELFNTSGTDVQKRFSDTMIKEVAGAQMRATISVAQEFPHLLTESQTNALRPFWGEQV